MGRTLGGGGRVHPGMFTTEKAEGQVPNSREGLTEQRPGGASGEIGGGLGRTRCQTRNPGSEEGGQGDGVDRSAVSQAHRAKQDHGK